MLGASPSSDAAVCAVFELECDLAITPARGFLAERFEQHRRQGMALVPVQVPLHSAGVSELFRSGAA